MNYFKKQQWIRIGACLVALAVGTLFMTGVFNGNNGPVRFDPAAGASASDAAVTATEQGFGGEVTVSAILNEDETIKELTIETPGETEGLGRRASTEEFTAQFIGKKAPFTFGEDGIEALSGATVTSSAALKALNRALTGEEPAAEPETGNAAGGDLLTLIAVSMGNEANNSYVTDYLEQDPYLVNIYEGYGFAKDYGSARGHAYTLDDVDKTQRPHAKANCLTCKTPDLHKMIEEQGVSVYSMPYEEVRAQITQPISCYTCHGSDDGNGGQMVVTHQYVNEALGENTASINAASLSCGQCHIEYYFTPSDSETMMPYHSVEEMTPDAILAYYDDIGFYDWEQPGTGTKMLKAQHPELETYMQGRHASLLSCADCHMPVKTTENGVEYHDHHLVSPLSSETLLAKCVTCHGSAENITARVREIQSKVTAREKTTGNRLSALKDRLTLAVAGGTVSEEKLEEIRKLHREAQWYFDYCYVENSEGAHNSSLAYYCLDTADGKIAEADALLDAEGIPAAETPKAEPVAEKAGAEAAADGTLTAVEQGFGGEVKVSVVLNEDKTIEELTVETPNETDGLGKRASTEEFTAQFLGKAAPFAFGENGIDALTGATVTSNAALKAINTAAAVQAEEAGAEAAADGALTAAEQGFGGEVKVSVVLNEDKTIKELTIETPGETEGLGKRASTEEFTAQFLGKAAPFAFGENGIDALTGATVTSNAALKAINTAAAAEAEEAGAEAAEPAEEPKTEEPAAEPAEEPKTEEPAAETKEAPKAEAVAGSEGTYGAYRVTKENQFSKVTVTATAKEGQLSSVKIESEGEQDLLTDEIRGEWAKAILDTGNAAPDAITSSTLTFSAGSVTEAMTEILAKIAGTPAAEPVAEPAETPAAETKEEPKAEAAAGSEGTYGAYRVTKENQFSKVTVTATAKEGQLSYVKIESEGEQDLLTDEIRGEWAKAILDTGSAAPDAITSSTLTFSAGSVSEAMTEILAKIAGTPAAEPAEEPKAEEPAAEPAEEPKAEEPAAEPAEEPKAEEPSAEPAEEPAPETKEEPKAEEPAASKAVFGAYRVTKENQFSKVTVTATAKEGQLSSVKIESEGEQDLLTDEIRGEWAKAILDTGSAAPDAITSSTLTFSAGSVSEAMTEILAKIAGTPAAEPAEEPKAEEPAAEPAEEPKAEEPAAEPAEEPKAEEPAAEPAEEPAEEPVAEPAEEPKAEEPAEEPVAEPAEEPAPETKEEPKAEAPAASKAVFGGYRVTKENQFSKVTVTATAKDGQLSSVKIESEGEQDLLTDEIRGEWAKAILETGNAAPDAITSSTLTFSAGSVSEAMTEILARIAGE